MIAALYESQAGGVNNFEKGDISFGWKAIEDMLSQEVQRKKQNQLSQVPAWTKRKLCAPRSLDKIEC